MTFYISMTRHKVCTMQGIQRKIVYVTLYEALAIVSASVGLAWLSGQGLGHAGVLAVIASAIAVVWNLAFNWLFERLGVAPGGARPQRPAPLAHAIGFEGGLAAFLVPVFAWWLDIGLWQALVMDLGLLLYFLAYTFVFNWGFDRVFGLPASRSAGLKSALSRGALQRPPTSGRQARGDFPATTLACPLSQVSAMSDDSASTFPPCSCPASSRCRSAKGRCSSTSASAPTSRARRCSPA